MGNLGKQVQAYMTRNELKVEAVAAKVRQFAGGADVKRQHIQGILDGIDRPRYIVALAKAMGTTAEILDAGLYSPDEAVEAPPPPPSIEASLETLARAIEASHPDKLEKIIGLLTSMARSPEAHALRNVLADALAPPEPAPPIKIDEHEKMERAVTRGIERDTKRKGRVSPGGKNRKSGGM